MLLVLLATTKLIHLDWTKIVVQRREMIVMKLILFTLVAHFDQRSMKCLDMLTCRLMYVMTFTVRLTFPLSLALTRLNRLVQATGPILSMLLLVKPPQTVRIMVMHAAADLILLGKISNYCCFRIIKSFLHGMSHRHTVYKSSHQFSHCIFSNFNILFDTDDMWDLCLLMQNSSKRLWMTSG